MTLLPIVDRELRVAARRSTTYWLRFWAALVTLALWLVLLHGSQDVTKGRMGQHLLLSLGMLALGFSMLAGIFLTCDCLCEEAREGTLGLLFLTNLKAYDVVLGKLAASSVNAFFALLAVFPVLGLAVLLGSVTAGEFWRLLLVCTATLFLSVSIGIGASAVSREARQALQRGLVTIAVVAGLFPTLWWVIWAMWKTNVMDFLLLPSPGYTFLYAFDVRYKLGGRAWIFWLSLATLFLMGLGCIAAAHWLMPRLWRDGARETSRRERVLKTYPRLALAWRNPAYWLTARDGSPRRFSVRLLAILSPAWFALLIGSTYSSGSVPVLFVACFTVAFCLHQIIKILIVAEASRRVHLDRQSGALELLLVTPLPVSTFLAGQKAALRTHFAPALIVLLLFNLGLCVLVWSFPKPLHISRQDRYLFCELFAGGILALFFDFNALGWVGIWHGLNGRKHQRAIVAALLQVMGIPWLLVFLLFTTRPSFGTGGIALVFAAWFVLGIVTSLASAEIARKRLEADFRLAAAERFGGKGA